jgi:4-amino-4-deoxy-L-arabinose transferase-like glycosyltransferase
MTRRAAFPEVMTDFHSPTPVPLNARAYWWVLAAAIPIFFLYLGANSIWDANEAFYVETPRQMVHSGDYVTPTFNGQLRFNKPVLSYWIVAGLYRLFGESVTVERAGIAMGAMALIIATVAIGRALRSPATGALAAIVVATAPRVIWFSRRIFIDVYLTAFLAIALACFVLAQRGTHRRAYLVGMYVALGFGVLTKGPVAVVLPAIVCVAWLALRRRLRDLTSMMLGPGILIILLIVVPWYVAVYRVHGWGPIVGFFVGENVSRYTSAMTPAGRGPWFYLPVLLGDLFPWAPLVVVPLVGIVLAWRRGTSTDAPAALRQLLWIWIVAFVAIFSFSQTKEDLYIFPIAPAVAVLVADALVDHVTTHVRGWIGILFVTVTVLLIFAAPALYWLFGPTAGYYRIAGVGLIAGALAATGLGALGCWLAGRRDVAIVVLGGGFVVLNYLFVAKALPGIEASKPVPPLARTLAERAAADAKVGYFNMGLQSFVYYSNRRAIEDIGVPEQAKAFFYDRRESWALMGVPEWDAVRTLTPDVCVAARHPLSIVDAKFVDLLTRRLPLDVLLVKNHCGR